MFRRLPDTPATVAVDFEGEVLRAAPGDSVAAVLLAAGVTPFRIEQIAGAPRAPWCMIGNCFECLVEIDGRANRQACMVTVREGMRIRRQRGAVNA